MHHVEKTATDVFLDAVKLAMICVSLYSIVFDGLGVVLMLLGKVERQLLVNW